MPRTPSCVAAVAPSTLMETVLAPTSRMRRAELVADILDAQHEDVVRVLAVDIQTGTSWDATREIADDVFNHLIQTGSNVQPWLVDFLEANISANELAPYMRRLAA